MKRRAEFRKKEIRKKIQEIKKNPGDLKKLLLKTGRF